MFGKHAGWNVLVIPFIHFECCINTYIELYILTYHDNYKASLSNKNIPPKNKFQWEKFNNYESRPKSLCKLIISQSNKSQSPMWEWRANQIPFLKVQLHSTIVLATESRYLG